MTDAELLIALLALDRLTDGEREAFVGMQRVVERQHTLTSKQLAWIRGAAERYGIQTAPSENIFSAMSPARQAEQRKAAEGVKLPWEK